MHIHALTVFGALLAIPCIVGLAQGKDKTTNTLLSATAIVAALLALSPFVDQIGDLMNGNLIRALAALAAVLGILVTVRIGNQVIATLTTVGGLLLAAHAFNIISG
jgi:hypothetical protein